MAIPQRLREVIKHNLSYLLFACIKDFKAALSDVEEAHLDIPEIDVDLAMTRTEFETLIAEPLAQVDDAVAVTLRKAELGEEAIDIVLRTGGSSLIPAVKNQLDARFPGKVVEHDPFTSVASGLAVASFYGWR